MSIVTDRPIQELFELQKKNTFHQRLSTAQDRIALLQKLKAALPRIQNQLIEALSKDVNKPAYEVIYMEYEGLIGAIDQTCAELEAWMQPERRPATINPRAIVEIRHEARGAVLVIGPWNVPFLLALEPTIAALAAGNCVIIKPSELTPHTSKLLAEFIPTVFPPEILSVVEGGIDETTELLALPFDHIFFTGSPTVGKVIMSAAAKNLTTVTLELGGKSPCLVDESSDIEKAAAAVMHKKTINGGQICIAPDYILVHKSKEQELIASLKKYNEKFYYETGSFNGHDMSHIINQRNYDRLKGLYEDALNNGANVAFGGVFHDKIIQIEPTVLTNVPIDSKIMHEEIFGPILPVVTYDDLEEAIEQINRKSKPLALYIFSQNKASIERIISRTSSGGVTVNEIMLHAFEPTIPFGGINGSGTGTYHGIYGFRELSHQKAIFINDDGVLDETLRPPFTEKMNLPAKVSN
ncbi:Coniferyl aldehyde dehydrogenase [Sphingobacterium multivorum]|uniref:aldehyde dehydrogenase family protein n=1 Tax=Sphingobacterium multivorum TaxID=28454 RepID=UPI000DFF9272|nr:aldehyde dehydrogenase family protein [Sphingobacterium multivorum]QQT46634.1 aldehyde dehydrogenase family protein [Sphingobacterium multivorum]SUJ89349.1 Coniferyl aldehyde dehydrogenase [Sphingobacterium multivorum]